MSISGTIRPALLGSIALEVIMMRNNLEKILEEKGRSKKEKQEAKKALAQLKEVEKGLIHLYLLSEIQRQRVRNPFLNYMLSKGRFVEKE